MSAGAIGTVKVRIIPSLEEVIVDDKKENKLLDGFVVLLVPAESV